MIMYIHLFGNLAIIYLSSSDSLAFPPCAVESYPTHGDNRGSNSSFGSISGVPSHSVKIVWTCGERGTRNGELCDARGD